MTGTAAFPPRPHRTRAATPTSGVTLPRLYALRAGYLIVGVGLAVVKWPSMISHDPWPVMEGVVNCLLTALSLLSLVGVRYPLQMLPVLLFESLWKLIWLAAVALPLWATHRLDSDTRDVASTFPLIVVIVAVIPWRYVAANYLTKASEPWRTPSSDR